MLCSKCGHGLPDDAQFCPECGQPRPKEAIPKGKQVSPEKKPIPVPTWWKQGLAVLAGVTVLAAIITSFFNDSEPVEQAETTTAEEPSSANAPWKAPLNRRPGQIEPESKEEDDEEEEPPSGDWELETDVSPLDDTKTVYLDLEADEPIWGPRGQSYVPVLTLMCKGDELQAYVLVGMQAERGSRSDFVTAHVRFDEGDPETLNMIRSLNDDALFFQRPEETIRTMEKYERMVFGFTPAGSDLSLTTFTLRGLSNAVEPLRRQCDWQESPEEASPP